MFNDKKDFWRILFKVVFISLSILTFAFGIVGGLADATYSFWDIGLGGQDDGTLDFIAWFIPCTVIAFLDFLSCMAISNIMYNVQTIRKKLENIENDKNHQ